MAAYRSAMREASPAAELSIVLPTFNERDNVSLLVEALRSALADVAWEAIFVDDDSADGTAEAVAALARDEPRVRRIRRIGRRGLAGAVLEGAMASSAPFVAVMDADLQHDETQLPRMLAVLRAGEADLVVASRYVPRGGRGEGLSKSRAAASRLAAWLARRVLGTPLADPVSGFFMIRREQLEPVARRLSGEGFKVLFDIVAAHRGALRIVELPSALRDRAFGESKLDGRIVIDYLGLLLARLSGGIVPPRALLFGLVGASGLVIHLLTLRLLLALLPISFGFAQLDAALVAMTSNFLINNQVTYRDRRLHGRALISGYLRFCALCGLGLVANVAVADLVHRLWPVWWLAGTAGALFGAAWNYVSTALAVW
jgi:dolichol-phosphate mannosyltransferase